jgi:hypothetical protein
LNDMLYSIDPNTMILGLLFVIFFAFINFALYKTIKNRGTSSIISFCVALLAVYGINRTSFDLTGIFSSIGISDKLIYTIVPILILIGLIFMIWKLKLGWTFILVGIALIAGSFFVYEKSGVFIVGIVLIILGIIILVWKNKKIKKELPNRNKGRDLLIDAAKKFKEVAKKEKNPKFFGTWAKFINWLGQNGWGGSEKEICDKLQITKDDFVDIFNKYGLV